MKSVAKLASAYEKFLASTVGVGVMLMVLTAFVASWKPKASAEKFTDCSMSGSCSI